MCGHVSIFFKNSSSKEIGDKIKIYLDSIVHRGPDDEGVYEDDKVILPRDKKRA